MLSPLSHIPCGVGVIIARFQMGFHLYCTVQTGVRIPAWEFIFYFILCPSYPSHRSQLLDFLSTDRQFSKGLIGQQNIFNFVSTEKAKPQHISMNPQNIERSK